MHQGVLRAANVKLPHFDMPSPWFTPTVVTVVTTKVCGRDIRRPNKISTCALEARHCSFCFLAAFLRRKELFYSSHIDIHILPL